tara:strand:+ start:189 stop:1184 length:996 start_codon:yes stop_codon:yes gene_type:complete
MKYRAKKPTEGGRYSAGQYRCQICEIYITSSGVTDGTLHCRCCNYRVRGKPRNRMYKNKFDNSQKNVKINNEYDETGESNYKESPIIQESNSSIRTYFELRDFIEDEIKPQSNYQFVMLKNLIGRDSAHKGEIAEDLALYNGHDPSNFEEVKKFLSVPVYDVLLNHNYVTKYSYQSKIYFSLNVELNEFQEYELDQSLEQKIEEWNRIHNIFQHEFDYNEVGHWRNKIDWNVGKPLKAIHAYLKISDEDEDITSSKKSVDLKFANAIVNGASKKRTHEIDESTMWTKREIDHLKISVEGLQKKIDHLTITKIGMQKKLNKLIKKLEKDDNG